LRENRLDWLCGGDCAQEIRALIIVDDASTLLSDAALATPSVVELSEAKVECRVGGRSISHEEFNIAHEGGFTFDNVIADVWGSVEVVLSGRASKLDICGPATDSVTCEEGNPLRLD
jgi:hypothetical protein